MATSTAATTTTGSPPCECSSSSRVNLDVPRWSQASYEGRARHFFTTTNPLNLLASPAKLDWAKDVVDKHRRGEDTGLSLDELWSAKHIYDSAFHPDTGEKMWVPGRMSAQVPCNMTITGFMMTFYKTTPQVVFWQWANQSFNAVVNYTNRAGDSQISQSVLVSSYLAATGGALATALGLNAAVKTLPPLFGRFVPFVSVGAANSLNIPMMRRGELTDGVPVFTESGEQVGSSKIAAREGITKVVLSRIGMAAPGMVTIPIIMNALEQRGVFKKYPRINAPLQIALLGTVLTFATPLCCAIFEQRASISVDSVEADVRERAMQLKDKPKLLYYNKGL